MPRTIQLALSLFAISLALPAQEIVLRVTVFDEKTGDHVENLGPENFEVIDDKRVLQIESAKAVEGAIDFLLLVDTSLVGEMVRPLAPAFIKQLAEGEQMAIVTYADAADLARDFTSSKQLLQTAIANVRYGNAPRVVDAVFASLDSGFELSAGRRAIILLSAGVEGRSRSNQFEALTLAREKGVSIYSVFVNATNRSLFRALSQRSGGAYFHSKNLKLDPMALGALVFATARNQYELTVSGAYSIGSRVQVKITGRPKSKQKLVATALVLE